MATLDLQDAYFMVPIAAEDRIFLRFSFESNLYEFNCLPFGLSIAPWIFTKIMRPVLSCLRERNFLSVAYLDDFLLLGNTFSSCLHNVKETSRLLTKLGFIINEQKSITIPVRCCKFLGFELNSERMTVGVPRDKQLRTRDYISVFLKKQRVRIRELAQLIGTLISLCPATKYGWVYTKELERHKYLALHLANDDYDSHTHIPDIALEDLRWWHVNIINAYCPIRRLNFKKTIFTDASSTGWGAVCGEQRAHGQWSLDERTKHINYLELLAVLFGLQCLAASDSDCELLLRVDNTTALAYVNRMGGIRFPDLNGLSRKIWNWCEARNIWLYASYIRSSDNIEADAESRRITSETEWSLSPRFYDRIVSAFGLPEIDLFASRPNAKCQSYVSWDRDPEAFAIDAFTLSWKQFFFYAFPPFAILPRVLQKIAFDKASGILVVPYWKTQSWYPLFTSLLTKDPIVLGPHTNMLNCSNRVHPMGSSLTLVAGVLSGNPS